MNKRLSCLFNPYLSLLPGFVVATAVLSGCAVQNPQPGKSIPVIPEAQQTQRTEVDEGPEAVEFYYPRHKDSDDDAQRISDKAIAYPAKTLTRLPVLLEAGDAFLNHGPIKPGIETPTGQMLQPGFLLYGSLRTALQSYDDGEQSRAEQANRIDLHGNLHLSGTERVAFSIRPLDRESGEFTGFNLDPSADDGGHSKINGTLTRLFFEGEFGEIFPRLDPTDSGTLDWGFSVGRQPVRLQNGLLLDDNIDLIGVTRNSLTFKGITNLRFTGIYSWNEIGRDFERDRNRQDDARLFGLLTEADTAWGSTMSLDLLYVDDRSDGQDADAWYLGAGSTQRHGFINSTFRVNASIAGDDKTAAVNSGVLLTAELSRTLHGSDNLVYFNAFWAIDHFTRAARSEDSGSTIASLGLLHSPVGMGRYGIPLGQSIGDTLGAVIGYQMYLDGIDSQLIVEFAARAGTRSDSDSDNNSDNADGRGVAVRYQRAIGRRHLLRLDGFVASLEGQSTSHGGRLEWLIKF